MKLHGKAFRVLSIILMLAIFAAGCGSKPQSAPGNNSSSSNAEEKKSDQKVTLKIMFQKKDGQKDYLYEWMMENIKLYKEKHPNIDFDVIANTCCDNYLTVVTTQMAANNLPDIFQGWTLERMRPFAEGGRLYDLGKELDKDPNWKKQFSEDALKGTTFKNGTFGIPLTMDAEVIYYNKEVFSKLGLNPPKTYDEFLNIVDTLKKNNIIPMTLPNKEPWVGSIPYMMLLERIGGLEAYKSTVVDKTGSWADQPFIEAAGKLQDLVKRGAFEDNANSITTKESEIKLSEGKAGMYAMGTWSIATLKGQMGDKLGFFNLPEIPGGKGKQDHYILLPNSALSMAQSSKHPQEAVDFLKFVFSQERMIEYAKVGFLTAYKVQTKPGELFKFNEDLMAEINKSSGTMYPWDVPLGVFMGKELNNTTQSLYTGADPKQALDKLQKTAESEKNKK